jgi:type VI protein secretion system component Hcp
MKNLYFFFIALCLLASNVSAQQIYFKATTSNTILTTGATLSKDFANYSELLSSQLGFSNEVALEVGGPSSSRPVFDKLTITKYADLATTKLMPFVATGNSIANVEIISTRSDDRGAPVITYKVELKDVFLTKLSTSAIADCACYSESYEMVYKAIRITTYSIDKSGKSTENPVKFVWNVETDRAEF